MSFHTISFSEKKHFPGHPLIRMHIRKAIRKALKSEGIREACELSVLLTDDEQIREINRDFRNVDSATDVLSFPENELVPGAFSAEDCERNPDTGKILLGDIVLSVPHCEEQAADYGHGFDREIMYLTVHSVLHLLGYDHVDEGEMKRQMREREKTIMGDE